MTEPRIEQVWAFHDDGVRAIGAVVCASMRNANLDKDDRPWRALIRIYRADGSTAEHWMPCATRAEAFAKIMTEKATFGAPWIEAPVFNVPC